jgi:protocatechuate 3,4-dioxygenase beta subunit
MRKRYSVFVLAITMLLARADAAEASAPASPAGLSAPTAQISISGKVTDWQGRPVEGAKVTLYGMAYSEDGFLPNVEVIWEKTTGVDGGFHLASSEGGNPYLAVFLIARRQGLALGWAMQRTGAEQESDVVLGEPRDLAGKVVDEKGGPIDDADVSIAFAVMGKTEDRRVLAVPGFLKAKTDDKGRFLFTDLPAEATFEFLVQKPGRVTLSTLARAMSNDSLVGLSLLQRLSGQRNCQFSPGQTGIRLTLPLEARIEGIVVEKSSGKPLGGVKVMTRSEERQAGFLSPDPVTTAEDGTFRIGGLPAGNGSVQLATTRGRMAEWVAEPVPVSLNADETKSGVKLELTRGGIIEVLVREDNGKPIAKAGVNVSHAQPKQYFGGNTDEDGLARIRVIPGQYRVSEPFRPGYAQRFTRKQVTIEEGQTNRVEFILNVAPRVTGTVRDETGHPLAGVRIAIAPMSSMGVVTDAKGEYALDWNPEFPTLREGTPVLVARDLARNLGEIAEIGVQTRRLDLQLKPAVTLTGTVLNQEDKPLTGARVLVMLRSSDRPGSLGLIEQVTTDKEGTFEVRALPAGRHYSLIAMAAGYGAKDIIVDASHLNDHRRNVSPFRLAIANLSISGMVVDSQDRPVAGATVSAIDGSLPPREDVLTDAEGQFVIQGVPAGSMLLMVSIREPRYMYGSIDANGGATGVKIVVSE